MNGLVSTTFSWEQKSGFTFEINKDLTFIMIIIDIDWYLKKYRDNFLGHITQPYITVVWLFVTWLSWACLLIKKKQEIQKLYLATVKALSYQKWN